MICVTSPGFITSAPNRFEFPSNDCSLKVNVADVNILLIEKISSHRSDNWTHLFIWSEKEMLGESPPIRAVPHHLHPKTNTHSHCDEMTHPSQCSVISWQPSPLRGCCLQSMRLTARARMLSQPDYFSSQQRYSHLVSARDTWHNVDNRKLQILSLCQSIITLCVLTPPARDSSLWWFQLPGICQNV